MISSVYISRFRGIRKGSIEGLEQVSVLIGRNGAGKSSVLEALYLVSACAGSRDVVRRIDKLDYVVNRRGGRGRWDELRRVLWYMGDTENPIEIQIESENKTLKFIAVDVHTGSSPIRMVTGDGLLIELEGGHVSKSIEDLKAGHWSMTIKSIEGELAEVKRFLDGFLLVDGVLARQPTIVEAFAWPRILSKRLDKHVVEIIREEFEPEAEGLTYVPSDKDYYLALQTARTAVRIDDLGDGARTALLAAMLVLAYRPTVLLVEEPELHMHPAGLYTYMKFLIRLAKDIGFQIIASTHSIELVQILQALAKELGIELAALYLEREDDVLRARSFSADDFEILRKLGIDIRFLYRF